jgi:putative transposase
MSTFQFKAGTRIQIDQVIYTMTRMVDDRTWQLEQETTKRIREESIVSLLDMYRIERLLAISANAPIRRNPLEHQNLAIDDQEFLVIKEHRMYVTAVQALPVSQPLFENAIKTTWNRLGAKGTPPNWTTVYRWLKRYRQTGGDIVALRHQNEKKGNRSSRFPEEVVEIVDQKIQDHFMQRTRASIEDILHYSAHAINQENKLRPPSMQLPEPTRRLVKGRIAEISEFDRYVARYGRDAAEMRFRAALNTDIATRPLQIAQIDHTLMDIFVVDSESMLPLGRPWLTTCLDAYTRCLLGLHISFEPPSYLTVAKCLRHAFEPKTDLQATYPMIDNVWEPFGVMNSVLVDNGMEFHSVALEQACYACGTEIRYAGRKKSWIKGKVERFLGTLNRSISHGIPGTTFSNVFEKGDYNPKKHAVLTFGTLKEIVHLWVADYYHQKPHRILGKPPIVAWRNEIDQTNIPLVTDLSRFDVILGRPEDRRLTHKGIEYDKLFYNSEELRTLRSQEGDILDVEIRVDDSELGWIYVFTPDQKRYYKVPCTDMSYARGISRWQHNIFTNYAAKELEQYDSTGWLDAKQKIFDLVARELNLKKHKRGNKRLARMATHIAEGTPCEPDTTTEIDLTNFSPATASETPSKAETVERQVEPRSANAISTPVSPDDWSANTRTPLSAPTKIAPTYRERRPVDLAD